MKTPGLSHLCRKKLGFWRARPRVNADSIVYFPTEVKEKCSPSTMSPSDRCIAYKPNNKRTYANICPKLSLKAQLDKSPKALTRLTPRLQETREFAKVLPRELAPSGENIRLTQAERAKPLQTRTYSGRFSCQENA